MHWVGSWCQGLGAEGLMSSAIHTSWAARAEITANLEAEVWQLHQACCTWGLHVKLGSL